MSDLLDTIETDIVALPERRDVTPDQACQLLDAIDGAQKRLREAKAELERWLIQWLPDNGGELRIGDTRYFVALKKKVKDRNVGATVRAILEATGGDEDAVMDCLSSNAVKPGAARKVLGDRFDEFFETTIEEDVTTQKPKQALQSINEKFIR